MKNKITLLVLSLFMVCFFTACEDDEDALTGPFRLAVLGPDTVAPQTTEEFTIGIFKNPETYTWTVDGPAEIVGSNTGATISVRFNSVGDVKISVTNGVDSGTTTVEVAEAEAGVTGSLRGTQTLRSGQSDTVFFAFDVPVSAIGGIMINTEDTTEFNKNNPFVSGTRGELVRVDDQNYYAIYTAGTGNGTPEAKLMDITSTAAFGSVNIDSAYVQLYRVDNTAPVADLSYSADRANEGSMVTVTARFTEPVMGANPSGVMFVTLSGAGVSQRDTLMATSDPLVYTYEYEVEDGDGPISVNLENIMDMAGNRLAGVNNTSVLFIDNVDPVVTGTATDAGSGASIVIGTNEAGTGMYLILKDGVAAPANAAAFMAAEGVASRSIQFPAGGVVTVTQALATGEYDVYFMAMDQAGNYSDIETVSLVMD